jgi:hypothetical protein
VDGAQTSVVPEGAPETGGGPVRAGLPLGPLALGVTGLAGAVLAGAAELAERRPERRS